MRIQFGKIIRESDVCVLCGERKATTREHIPPQSLFIKKPREYLVVPCCKECNNSTKLDDEYLRQVMAGASLIGQGRNVWKNKVAPKFKDFPKTQAGLRENLTFQIVRFGAFERVIFPAMKIDAERVSKSVRKMVWGLYWFHSGRILGPTTELSVNYLDTLHGPEYLRSPAVRNMVNQTVMGVYQDPVVMNTFFYTGVIDQNISVWFFNIYKQSLLVAITKESG
jgi:hypothetical protein